MLRASQGIPACVWIINQHTEEITVVVSKHRPDRLLSGGGLNAGLTSAGLTYTTTVCIPDTLFLSASSLTDDGFADVFDSGYKKDASWSSRRQRECESLLPTVDTQGWIRSCEHIHRRREGLVH